MKTIGKALLFGIVIALVGLIFSDLFGTVINGFGWDTGRILGMGAYLCITLVVCTGVIVSQINKDQ